MATGRIRRSARRGLTAAVLGWLGVAAFSVLMAPSATAAPSATVEIRTVTPPAVSVDKGGQVTFVNRVDSYSSGVDLGPLVGSFTATVNTDVSVTFFGQTRGLQPGQSTAWNFNDPATTGTITYTYRIVPQAGLAAAIANQVVNGVAAALPALPAPTPYVVQTIVPNLPNLPSVNLPQLPTVSVPALPLPGGTAPIPGAPPGTTNPLTPPGETPTGTGAAPQGLPGGYQYDTGVGAARLSPSAVAAAAAFDPSRYYVPGSSLGGPDRNDSSGATNGAGGAAGGYDGASVPVFGQLAGLDGSGLDDQNAQEASSSSATGSPALPAAALAAVVALAAVTAALVRTHQASRTSK
jgi:hypothetical protein